MKEIKLTRGYVAIVDDEDFEWLKLYRWQIKPRYRDNGTGYAWGRINGVNLSMHRAILHAPVGSEVDHINRLDNRRSNLRFATRRQNTGNSSKPKNGKSSRFKGVYLCRQTGKFRARGRFSGGSVSLGHYSDEEYAARAYDSWALQHYGEFAKLNFP